MFRCDTDVAFGRRNGLDTLLVLSGEHQLSDVKEFQNGTKSASFISTVDELLPKFYANSVANLLV